MKPPATLREQAEAKFPARLATTATDSDDPASSGRAPDAMQAVLHELQVHQVELEMQNEALQEAQTALDAERTRYFDLYDLAPVGYFRVSEPGLILQANLTGAGLLGMARNALINRPFYRHILKEDQDIFYRHRRLLTATQAPQTCELRLFGVGGSTFWAQLTLSSTRHEGREDELRIVMSDISLRRRAEDERAGMAATLRQQNHDLQLAKHSADKANLAKSEFLSSMTHELRTPLNAILGFAQLIESGAPSPTASQKKSVDQILRAGWYLLTLINDILDLSAIESGKSEIPLEVVSLETLLQECHQLMAPQAEERGISMVFPLPGCSWLALGEATRIRQVIINLLSNAIKFNVISGVVNVGCTLNVKEDAIRITVQDTGAGLSEEQLGQLFDPFNRLGQEAGRIAGTGIGLVICKRLVGLMGGTMGAISEPGKGSTFWFQLRHASAHNLALSAVSCPTTGAAFPS